MFHESFMMFHLEFRLDGTDNWGGARPAGPARSTTGALLLLMQPAPTNVCCASRVIYALAQLGRYTISDLIELGILCVEVPSIGGPP